MTDNGIKYIGKHCVKLNYLNIKGYKAVRDVGITHIVQNCFKLIFLDIGKCNIMDYGSDGMHIISIHWPPLKKLIIRRCEHMTATGIKTTAAQCCSSRQYLQVLEILENYR